MIDTGTTSLADAGEQILTAISVNIRHQVPALQAAVWRCSMAVRRIVVNVAAERIGPAKAFYGDALKMNIVMDLGWITTFAAEGTAAPQISVATEGGSGTPVPDLSIEVDDLAETLQRMQAGAFTVEYGPVTEPWGVKRFYVRDPFGRLVHVLEHQ
jgi:catechol 2,3-dioxygenase-like lactoylglutathione lyase family enzyme